MKTKLLTLLFTLFLSIGLFGQPGEKYQIKNPVGISSVGEAASISRQILEAADLKSNFLIAEANVPNAVAILHQGKRYVLYNPSFINRLTKAAGTKWAAVSVLAHEIGHHLYFSLSGETRNGLATELEADKFSGYVLQKMGATLEEAQVAMSFLATPFATSTHPGQKDRLSSIADGYESAGGIVPGKEAWAAERSAETKKETIAFPASQVLAKLQFNNAPEDVVLLTKKLNVVHVADDGISVLGNVSRTANRNFPFVISGGKINLFISAQGQIVNSKGNVIGRVLKA